MKKPNIKSQRQCKFDLERGSVVIGWPSALTVADHREISEWLDIVKRIMARDVVEPADTASTETTAGQ